MRISMDTLTLLALIGDQDAQHVLEWMYRHRDAEASTRRARLCAGWPGLRAGSWTPASPDNRTPSHKEWDGARACAGR